MGSSTPQREVQFPKTDSLLGNSPKGSSTPYFYFPLPNKVFPNKVFQLPNRELNSLFKREFNSPKRRSTPQNGVQLPIGELISGSSTPQKGVQLPKTDYPLGNSPKGSSTPQNGVQLPKTEINSPKRSSTPYWGVQLPKREFGRI